MYYKVSMIHLSAANKATIKMCLVIDDDINQKDRDKTRENKEYLLDYMSNHTYRLHSNAIFLVDLQSFCC